MLDKQQKLKEEQRLRKVNEAEKEKAKMLQEIAYMKQRANAEEEGIVKKQNHD